MVKDRAMKWFWVTVSLTAILLMWESKAGEGPITYYVQLVRGTDTDTPPVAGSRQVGAKLAKQFEAVFKWRHYWEIASRELVLEPGQTKRVRLNPEREVEIDLRHPQERAVVALWKGAVVERTVCPVSGGMTFIGGDRDPHSAWFIVVRRDKPAVP
jgi:hypothetical protein